MLDRKVVSCEVTIAGSRGLEALKSLSRKVIASLGHYVLRKKVILRMKYMDFVKVIKNAVPFLFKISLSTLDPLTPSHAKKVQKGLAVY